MQIGRGQQLRCIVEHADDGDAASEPEFLYPPDYGSSLRRLARQPQPRCRIVPPRDRPGGEQALPTAISRQRVVEITSGDAASSRSASLASASISRASFRVDSVRGGSSGTPGGTSRIRSRGNPAASNSRRAAGLAAAKTAPRWQLRCRLPPRYART